MSLDHHWILGLTKDFQEVIITDEVESGELGSLLLKITVQCFLAHIQLAEDGLQSLFDTRNITKTDHLWVSLDTECDISVLIINSHESSLFLWKRTPHEDRLQIHPFPLDHIKLGQIVVDSSQLLLNLLDLVGKSTEVARLLQGEDEALMVTDLAYHLFPFFDERSRAVIRFVLSQDKLSVLAPNSELINGFSDSDLTQSFVTELFDLLCFLYHDRDRVNEVPELHGASSHGFVADPQDCEQPLPVLLLE